MNDALVVQELQAQDDPTSEKLYTTPILTGLLLVEFGVFDKVETQVTAVD